jgi:hypothetical protein
MGHQDIAYCIRESIYWIGVRALSGRIFVSKSGKQMTTVLITRKQNWLAFDKNVKSGRCIYLFRRLTIFRSNIKDGKSNEIVGGARAFLFFGAK